MRPPAPFKGSGRRATAKRNICPRWRSESLPLTGGPSRSHPPRASGRTRIAATAEPKGLSGPIRGRLPDRALNRLTTAFRIFAAIPIAIMLSSIGGASGEWWGDAGTRSTTVAIGGTGLLFVPPLLMIVFRQKYPRW